jgi:hypothetical protein
MTREAFDKKLRELQDDVLIMGRSKRFERETLLSPTV